VTYGSRQRWLVPLAIAALGLLADQATKLWIVQTLGPETLTRSIPLVGDWLRFIYSHNTGIAFSLLTGNSNLIAVKASAIVLAGAYVYWRHLPNGDRLVQLATGLILSGALGNLTDRIRLGYVVDFIQVGWFPVFNIADSAICVGAVLLALRLLQLDTQPSKQEQAAAS
jgi:signal peptidase II